MPSEIDPEWEYWEPNPEIAGLMAAAQAGVGILDRLVVIAEDGSEMLVGFRCGRGNPDHFRERFSPEACEQERMVRALLRREETLPQGRSRQFMAADRELFRRLWNGGAPVWQIMEIMGIQTVLTVKRWRRTLGLRSRPQGNHHPERLTL